MEESEFETLAQTALDTLERVLEAVLPDADLERKGSGVLEVTLGNGSRMVVNRHSAAQEVWVAARSGGYHFRFEGGRWRDTRSGEELFAALSRLVSAQGGVPVLLARDSPGAC